MEAKKVCHTPPSSQNDVGLRASQDPRNRGLFGGKHHDGHLAVPAARISVSSWRSPVALGHLLPAVSGQATRLR